VDISHLAVFSVVMIVPSFPQLHCIVLWSAHDIGVLLVIATY
jgi:hypothetical protein